MKGSVLVTAAVVGLLSAGAAHAQTTTTQSGTTIVPNTGINVVPNTLSTPNGFVPGSTFVPGTGFVAPDGTLLDGFGTFSPGFYPGFYPGYTTGYFNPYGYNPYFNQTYDTSYSFDQSRYSAFRPRMMSTVVPTLGINTPPLRPGYRTARVPGPRLSGTTVRQRVAGSRQETTGTEYVNLISPQQVKLASHMEDVMEDRPITEGTVTDINSTGVLVRYQVDGESKIMRFTPGQVFFFHQDGKLATAAGEPDRIHEGSKVLIPLPINREPRQSVAGSRQESRIGESSSSYGTKSDAQPGISSRVMGSRQSTRSRRPAK